MDKTDSVYKPPESELDTQVKCDIPEEILKKIKHGWIAAIVSGVMTFLVVLLTINTGALIDVVLIFILAFGIYKKSRFAATFMLLYFLLSKIWIIVETGKPSGFWSLIFLYFYFQAMVATYRYHKLV